ncbi:MAG: thiamine diphosphokinase [Oscillospiraceae bacterium]
MKKTICIVGAGDMSGTRLVIPTGAAIIAADGGLSYLEKAGISPDLILGDFDSLGRIPEGENVLPLNPEKDDTDMLVAVKMALEMGAEVLVIYGGLGGRFDHSLANLQVLAFIANHGARGYLVGCGSVCTAFKNGGIAFDEAMSGTVSVFSVGEIAQGVDLVGLKYPLHGYTLTNDTPLGVSNEFLGAPASVSVGDGMLWVMWSGDSYAPEHFSQV